MQNVGGLLAAPVDICLAFFERALPYLIGVCLVHMRLKDSLPPRSHNSDDLAVFYTYLQAAVAEQLKVEASSL